VNAATAGDTIRVAGGTYHASGGGTVAVITKTIGVVGGYDPSCSSSDPDMYQTVLDGQ